MGVKPIKILHLIASTGIGGAEQVLLNICSSLRSKEFNFEACLFAKGGKETSFARLLEDNNIPLCFVRMKFPLYIKEIYNLLSFLRKENISVIHCHGFRADVLGGIAAKLCKIPAVSTVHGWTVYSPKMQFYKWLDIKALHFFFKTILPVSNKLQLELIKNGIPLKKILLFRNIPAQRRTTLHSINSPPQNGPIQIGFIGRLSLEKGINFLLDAAAKIKETGSFCLHIVGDGPNRAEIEQKIKFFGLEELVNLHGYLQNPEKIYQILDILVLPSLTEGIPLTLLEAMSFGIPVIASDVGGIPEIIEDNKSGLLVKPGSVDDLINKITLLIKEPPLRTKLANGAKERISLICNFEKWKQTLSKVYDELGRNSYV
jgi:glycosyltransferase involved in cell wall biosynthesis